jgi:tRNA threonylcarbamoyl adenosine modification protein YeaZ
MLLAIDTSAGTSVAIVDRDAGVLAQRSSADTRSHAEQIGTFIAECLAEAGHVALSGVAIGMGPGPYTGLRVGIAAARAFAFGIGRPVVPIASHDAIAYDLGRAATIATDARRRELAVSVYAPPDADGIPVRVSGPVLVPRAELPPGAEEFLEVNGAAVGLLAERLHLLGRAFGPDQPLYLRAPDVTIAKGPKRVSQ